MDLFFVLSGFLIGGFIWENAGKPGFLRTFFVRRAVRILPLYYLYLLAATLLGVLAAGGYDRAAIYGDTPPWSYPLFLQNYFMAFRHSVGAFFGLLWSLAIEEQFYLLAPVLGILLPKRWGIRVAIALMFFCPILRLVIEESHIVLRWWAFTPARCDGLVAGLIMAWLVRAENHRAVLISHRSRHRLGLVLLGLILLPLPAIVSLGGAHLIFSATGLSFLVLFVAGIIGYQSLHGPSSRVGRLLRWSGLRALGRLSYFIYLFHLVAQHAAYELRIRFFPATGLQQNPGDNLTGLFFVLCAAAVSWRCFESPLLAWGRRKRLEIRP